MFVEICNRRVVAVTKIRKIRMKMSDEICHKIISRVRSILMG